MKLVFITDEVLKLVERLYVEAIQGSPLGIRDKAMGMWGYGEGKAVVLKVLL